MHPLHQSHQWLCQAKSVRECVLPLDAQHFVAPGRYSLRYGISHIVFSDRVEYQSFHQWMAR